MVQHTGATSSSSCHNKNLSQGEERGFFYKAFIHSGFFFPKSGFSPQTLFLAAGFTIFEVCIMQNLHNLSWKRSPPITNLFHISELILFCKRLPVFSLSVTTCGFGSEAGKQNTSKGTAKRQILSGLIFFLPCYVFFIFYLYFFDVSVFCKCWARNIKAIIALLKIQCSLPLLSCFLTEKPAKTKILSVGRKHLNQKCHGL